MWELVGDSHGPYVVGILSGSMDEWAGSVDEECSVWSGGLAIPNLVNWAEKIWA